MAFAVVSTAGALSLGACSSSDRSVAPPQPSAQAAKSCRALHAALPAKVDGQARTKTSPASPYTAAWGDIVLRCGVAAPKVDPTAQLFTIEGVDWYQATLPSGGSRFTTVGREAVVAVDVPGTHRPEADALVDLGAAVARTVLPTAKAS